MIKELSIPANAGSPRGDVKLFTAGANLTGARAAMIMIHGRGATAQSILELANYFDQKNIVYIAPQAVNNIWYPYSFLAPEENNEPHLSSALNTISDIVSFVIRSGIPAEKIMLLGFSQGACLALEWTARQGESISAVFGLSGGLIGPTIVPEKYRGPLSHTKVFLGCSDVDFHIPKERVIDSAGMFKTLNAEVTMKLYENMGHTVNQDEIDFINRHIETIE
ncbi:MAG: alpha/beta hydrolase [Bacteroidota bacterium]